MNDLFARLGLQHEPYFNWKKAYAIFITTMLLVVGINLVIKPSLLWQVIGSSCFVVVVRILIGSPVESVLTAESVEKLNQWINDGRENK